MIREAVQRDADAVLAIYEPIVIHTFISFETEVPTSEEMAERIDRSIEWLVDEDADSILGYAYAVAFHARAAYRWSTEVSIYVAPEAQWKGIGRTLLDELLERLRRRGFVNAFAGIALPNDASVRLFESLGFSRIALQRNVGFKLGAWHDVGWWQLQLREPTVPPPADPFSDPTRRESS